MGEINNKKIVLFGAGMHGKLALEKFGKDQVAYFIDNNPELWGKQIREIDIISFDQFLSVKDEYNVVISTKYANKISEQLINNDITTFEIYTECDQRYYPTDELIVNPYKDDGVFLDASKAGIANKIKEMNEAVDQKYRSGDLFDRVEIETINRCNGGCSFCPVSKQNDKRIFHEMSWELFTSIIDQLAEINYSGKLALFSNNEPFLDATIIDKHKYAREKLPNARMTLFTNGTLLTLDKFIEIMPYLDEMVVDNYHQQLELIKPCREIVAYCEEHKEYAKKFTVVLRKQQEFLTNRGGDAPNRDDIVSYPEAKCVLPFRQMIIRPDGKVSLCCNDPLGKNTLADLTKETILEAWNNQRFQVVRESLYAGRANWKHCEFCDVFNLG